MTLRDRQHMLALADEVLRRIPGGSEAEVVIDEADQSLTRYALNTIHQNVAETALQMRLRLVGDGRVGIAELRGESEDVADRLVRAAEEARRLAPQQTDLAPLPTPEIAGGDDAAQAAWSDATATATPEHRADAVAVITRAAEGKGLQGFGAYETSARQLAVVNTRGVRRHARTTLARLTAVLRGADGAGYADRCGPGIAAVDPAAVAGEVVDTAMRNQRAAAAEPGDYEVVLAPYAVAEMLEYLSWLGFGALAKQEERSFMRPGERLMSETVTLRDDASDPVGLPFPFDYEGVATEKVTFVQNGVCRDYAYDTPTAMVDGVRSTGHALPLPNTVGPVATHLAMEPGDRSAEELVAEVRRGLYVTRFWYVREVHPLRTVITGMTREGTFRIEDGRVTTPVRDLRFTQSIVGALADVRGISRERRLEIPDEGTATLAPWLHLGRFHFSS
jgi:predicted Zn-dependent protease